MAARRIEVLVPQLRRLAYQSRSQSPRLRFLARQGSRADRRSRSGRETRPIRTAASVRHEATFAGKGILRSEEHTSELQSLMRISYAVFCLKKKISNKMQQTKNRKKTKQ